MWTSFSSKENVVADMFRVALELKHPWELKDIEFDDQVHEWNLFLDFERGTEIACPHCGAPSKAYDADKKSWRHLDFWNWKTYIHARVNRANCLSYNIITQVPLKWSLPKSHFTFQQDLWATPHLLADVLLRE